MIVKQPDSEKIYFYDKLVTWSQYKDTQTGSYIFNFNLSGTKHFNVLKSCLQARKGSESTWSCCCCCCYSVSVHQVAVALKMSQHVQQEQKMRVVWQRAPCGLLNIHVPCSRTLISHFHVYGGNFKAQLLFERLHKWHVLNLAFSLSNSFQMEIKFINKTEAKDKLFFMNVTFIYMYSF